MHFIVSEEGFRARVTPTVSCSLRTKGQVCHAPIVREGDKGGQSVILGQVVI